MRNSGGKTLIKEKVIKFFWTQGYVKKKVIRGLFRFNISVHLNSNYTLDLICSMMISLRVITSVNGGKNAFPYFRNFISSKWLFFSTYRMGLAISLVATIKEKVSYLLKQKDKDIIPFICSCIYKIEICYKPENYLLEILWKWKNQQQILFFLLTIKEFS